MTTSVPNSVAVFGSDAGYADDGIDVFGVDVEDRDRLAASDAGGEARRMFFGVAGREAEKIVNDYVNRAADGVAREVGVVHGLGENTLSGECGVAVDEKRKIFFAAAFAGAILLGTGAADGHGVDSFEVARIRDEVDVNVAAARVTYSPVAPMWYLTSPEPSTLRGSTSSNPAKISCGGRLAT